MVTAAPRKPMRQEVKTALDLGPLLVFFITYVIVSRTHPHPADQALPPGMMWATITFMAATLISLAISYSIEHKIHPMPLITGAVILVFGGLTLFLHDQRFMKEKPTIVYLIFAAALLGGLAFGKLFIRQLLGSVLQLTDEGWRVLTIRWGIFFVAAAILNEIIWRNFSTGFWITFKVWGFMGLTLVFAMWQAMLVTRYQVKSEQPGETPTQ